MYKLLLLFLLPALMYANPDGKYTKTKIVKKEFTVNKDALLTITNKYGNIDVVTWNENKIVFEITITTNGNDEEKVKDRLDDITIEFSGTNANVSAKTIIESSSKWSLFKSSNVNFKINYLVKVPVTNHVNLNNDYGNILIDKLEGNAKINCDYGKIIIGSLMSKNNYINLDYAPESTIAFVNEAKINADYSKLNIDKSNYIVLNADYSNTVFENVKSLNFNADYGNITVGTCESIVGNSDYLTVKIGKISNKLILKTSYGAVKIKELQNDFNMIDIKTSFTGVHIGVLPNSAFNFEGNYQYGNLKFEDLNFTFHKKETDKTSKSYAGYLNNGNSKSLIKINSTYGNTTFTSN